MILHIYISSDGYFDQRNLCTQHRNEKKKKSRDQQLSLDTLTEEKYVIYRLASYLQNFKFDKLKCSEILKDH
jgi:hypothetical protein